MSNDYDYDLIALGAGSGGLSVVERAASYGQKCAVVEHGKMGGTCVNVGCIPKKLFVYASHFAEDYHNAQGFGFARARPQSLHADGPVDNRQMRPQHRTVL